MRSLVLVMAIVLLGSSSCASTDRTAEPLGAETDLGSIQDSGQPTIEDSVPTAAIVPEADLSFEAALNDQYENCLLAKDFSPGGVQVLLTDDGQPWWVKTGQNVPAEMHGPCLEEIGGTPNGRPSWG